MVKQVIVIRKDLKMRRGKEIAQGAHASSQFLVDKIMKNESLSEKELEWVNNGKTKITLQVNSEEELLRYFHLAKNSNVQVNLIQDSGKTEFSNIPTYTCVAIGPDEDYIINRITENLRLY